MQVTAIDGITIEFNDTNIVNIDNAPYSDRVWAIGNEFGTLAIVFADSEQDAIDEAADAGKLDCLQIPDEEHDCSIDCEALHAGGASEPFDQSYLWMRELPKAHMSLEALYPAMI